MKDIDFSRALVISIKPNYAKLIYEGKKQWEFRKAPPPLLKELFVYESAPVSCITGVIIFSSMICGSVCDVYESIRQNTAFTKNLTGISFSNLLDYVGRGQSVAALRVGAFRRFPSPAPLVCKPPQNWGTCCIANNLKNSGV